MVEYIEREATLKEAESRIMWGASAMAVYETIQEAPAADVAPVVHGRWVRIRGMAPPEYHGRHMCSICYARALDIKCQEELSGFCPNCGAKMDGEEHNG